MKRSLAALAVLVLSMSCEIEEPPPLADNQFPTARLVVPQIVVVGDAVDVDASASSDDDEDDVLALVFSFGDGSPQAETSDLTIAHVWSAPGTVTVAVDVKDQAAFTSRAEVTVVVVEGSAEACSCELPCEGDGICTDRGCLVFGSADEDDDADDAGLDDVVDCG